MKHVPPAKLALVLLASTLLFFSGFGLGALLLENQALQAHDIQEDIKTEILGLEVEQSLLLKNPCNLASLNSLGKSLGEVETKISLLDEKSGSPDVLELKKIHAILQIKHWQLIQLSVEECNSSYVPILYFYSNIYCEDCKTQGFVLSYVKGTNPNAMIYSFDSDMDFSVISTLEEIYHISGLVEEPVVIIGDTPHKGLQDSATLISLAIQENPEFRSEI